MNAPINVSALQPSLRISDWIRCYGTLLHRAYITNLVFFRGVSGFVSYCLTLLCLGLWITPTLNPCMLVQFYRIYPKKLVCKGDRMENIFLTQVLSPVGSHQAWDRWSELSWGRQKLTKAKVDKAKPLLMIIYPITSLWSVITDFSSETSRNFNRRHWPSVVLQMAARGVVQLTSYHPPLVLLSMATHPRCTLSSASMNPQLVYVGCQPLDHSNVLFWNNYYSYTVCDDNIRANVCEGNQFFPVTRKMFPFDGVIMMETDTACH